MKEYNIAVLKGDGIGPEIVDVALKVLDFVSKKYNFKVNYKFGLIGGVAIDNCGCALPDDTISLCKSSQAVILGAVGGPKWDSLKSDETPEAGLLGIRKELNLFANLRPSLTFDDLKDFSPLKSCVLQNNIDIMIVRELTGGIYFGKKGRGLHNNTEYAFDTEYYSKPEIERILRVAFKLAMNRNKKLCCVDKSNVLFSSKLWRETAIKLSCEYPEIELSHLYVDNCSMQLILNPNIFDVIVTSNLFGDILSDEASVISGSIGMLPSASLGLSNFGLYEPVHGSAPDLKGKDVANPLATILSVAMMLKYSLNEPNASNDIYTAVNNVLKYAATQDIYVIGKNKVSTSAMGYFVIKELEKIRR